VRQHEVVEVERVLAEAGDVDDARRCRLLQQRKQSHRQQERSQVVDRESQLVTVGAGPPVVSVRLAGTDARVADEDARPRPSVAPVMKIVC